MPESSRPRLRGPGGELARLMLAQLFLNACFTGTRMAAPLQALRLGHGEAAVGLLIALFALAQVFLALPAGRYCERHGLKRPIAAAVVVAVAGGGLAAAWPVFPVLCVGAFLTGGAGGVAIIAMQRHMARVASEPAALRQAFSWLAIGLALSNFLGPVLAGVVIDSAGFRAAFLAMAALPLIGWLSLRGAADPVPAAPGGTGRSAGAWDLLREPGLRRLLIVTGLLSACWDVHTFVVPVLGHERGLPASVIGSILGAFGIAAAAVRLLTPLVAAQLREWVILFGAMLATAVLFGVYPLMQAPLAMGVCSALLGFSLGSTLPMVMSLLHQLAPEHRYGEAVAVRVIVINMSSVGIPMVSGLAGSLIGAAGVFWAAGVMVGAGARLAAGFRPQA
ncbi:MFS transporter [Polaromonas sp. JS666]|uniref:MFS transporter n=1 Tax=Polaromonas sp. (strain JS666 / ATCC BAA-500) TaxID=296591 RepID=UPI0008921F6B|nr:MFS transporter [Polaromonas sp. JS666]SDN95433.1 Predicted arabinose efflux permease, MFS family [Polaromonas sp. JS666]